MHVFIIIAYNKDMHYMQMSWRSTIYGHNTLLLWPNFCFKDTNFFAILVSFACSNLGFPG